MEESKWLVLWVRGVRIGSVPLTEENLETLKSEFYMTLIQRDESGTEHWEAKSEVALINR